MRWLIARPSSSDALSRFEAEYSEARRWRGPEMEAGSIPDSYFRGDGLQEPRIDQRWWQYLCSLSRCPDRSSGPAGVRLTSRVIRCGCSWHQSVISHHGKELPDPMQAILNVRQSTSGLGTDVGVHCRSTCASKFRDGGHVQVLMPNTGLPDAGRITKSRNMAEDSKP
jgi:hypothetical protein